MIFDTKSPVRSLVLAFVSWKAFLLLIAVVSSFGPAYDTSTTLLSPDAPGFREPAFDLATRLTRWDAIYFVQAARRGYVFEQEWAFGKGLPAVISLAVKSLETVGIESHGSLEAWIGVLVAHLSHLLSVLVLHQLSLQVLKERRVSFIAAMLHVISPAGIFLSAPYAESPFALLSFAGYSLFASALEPASGLSQVLFIASGALFGLATTFRSNGLLNGLPFAVFTGTEVSKFFKAPSFLGVTRIGSVVLGGLAVALGYAGPQALAYWEFCSGPSAVSPPPTWCTRRVPGIYTYVQERYWNVGFLRYWVAPNIPLFLLAAPMLAVMLRSGFVTIAASRLGAGKQSSPRAASSDMSVLVQTMAATQLLLTVLAITSYHVQIINRISSGYPVWYWWLARSVGGIKSTSLGTNFIVFMIMYAAIQGALFASFLPPA